MMNSLPAPVSVPIRVDWWTMMRAKLSNAARPSRVLLLVVASYAIGAARSSQTGGSALEITTTVFLAAVTIRLLVMALSAAHDRGARDRFTGTLTFSRDGVELSRPDGTSESHPWTWILAARVTRDVLLLTFDVRGGRGIMAASLARLESRGQLEQLTAHLRSAGKLSA